MASELRICEKSVLPHGCDFFWRILEPRTKRKVTNTEVVVSVVDCNSQCGADLVPHEFLLLLERVFLSGAIELRSFDGAD